MVSEKHSEFSSWRRALSNRRVYLETYGCRFNFGDTAKLIEVLKASGSTIVESPDTADAVIINTCTVVGPTERRMLRRISAFRDRDLFVTGCMPAVQKEAIYAISQPTIVSPEEIRDEYRKTGSVQGGPPGIVQIASGCTGKCSYCITRKARGPLISYPEEEILDQVQAFFDAGTAEVQMTAQDVSAWGKDCGRSLSELLESVGKLRGRGRVRVGMMNPFTVKDQLDLILESFRSPVFFRFIHIPVQSGSDKILTSMKRGYTLADFEKIVAGFRSRYPGISLSTDVIVGYPGETLGDFQDTCNLIERIRPNKVNITRYSHRPHTGRIPGPEILDAVKKDRSRMLNALAENIYASINGPLVGTEVPVIVTEYLRDGSVMARTPEYHGVVLREDLPIGFEGRAVLKRDRKYFFIGERSG